MSVTIQRATAADEPDLIGLYLAMMRELAGYGYDLEPTLFNATVLVRSFMDAFEPVIVARDGNRLVGFLCWCVPTKGHAVKPIAPTAIGHGRFVLPEYRRCGIATRMIEAALPILRNLGIKRLVVGVLERNESGREHLLSRGATVFGRQYELKI